MTWIIYQEKEDKWIFIVMEHLNNILLHKSRPGNKQHENQSIYYETASLTF